MAIRINLPFGKRSSEEPENINSKRYKPIEGIFQNTQKDINELSTYISNNLCNYVDSKSIANALSNIPADRIKKFISRHSKDSKFNSYFLFKRCLEFYHSIPEDVWNNLNAENIDSNYIESLAQITSNKNDSELSEIVCNLKDLLSSLKKYQNSILKNMCLVPNMKDLNLINIKKALLRLENNLNDNLILSIFLTPDNQLEKLDQVTLFPDHLEKLIEMNNYNFLISFLNGSIRKLFQLKDSDPLIKKAYSHMWRHFPIPFNEELNQNKTEYIIALSQIPSELNPRQIFNSLPTNWTTQVGWKLFWLMSPDDWLNATNLHKVNLSRIDLIDILKNTPPNQRFKVVTFLGDISEDLMSLAFNFEVSKVFVFIPNLYELDSKKIREKFQQSPNKLNDPTFILTTLLPCLENNETELNRLIDLNHHAFLNSVINGTIRNIIHLNCNHPLIKKARLLLTVHEDGIIPKSYIIDLLQRIQYMVLDSQRDYNIIPAFQGNLPKQYSWYLANYAKSTKNSELLEISQQINQIVILRFKEYQPNSTPNQVQGGTQGHAVFYLTEEDKADGTLSFTLYNSGEGAHTNEKNLCAPIKYSRLTNAQINGNFFKKLNDYVNMPLNFSLVSQSIDSCLLIEQPESNKSTPTWHKPQKQGSCSFKCLSQFVSSKTKLLGKTKAYKGFKVFLTKNLIEELSDLPNKSFEGILSSADLQEIKKDLQTVLDKRLTKFNKL